IGVAVGVLRIGVRLVLVRVVRIVLVRAATQLGLQPVKVHYAAVVLQLTCHLHLLGLGSAAPHWLDPLEHSSGPIRPLLTATAAGRLSAHSKPTRRPLHDWRTARASLRTRITVPGL